MFWLSRVQNSSSKRLSREPASVPGDLDEDAEAHQQDDCAAERCEPPRRGGFARARSGNGGPARRRRAWRVPRGRNRAGCSSAPATGDPRRRRSSPSASCTDRLVRRDQREGRPPGEDDRRFHPGLATTLLFNHAEKPSAVTRPSSQKRCVPRTLQIPYTCDLSGLCLTVSLCLSGRRSQGGRSYTQSCRSPERFCGIPRDMGSIKQAVIDGHDWLVQQIGLDSR